MNMIRDFFDALKIFGAIVGLAIAGIVAVALQATLVALPFIIVITFFVWILK